jgi:two-component system, OmpR family, sensor histidine kinase TctE
VVVSLRLRLFMIILLPLLIIATAVGYWRIIEARETAEDLYDRNLVFTAVAVARDMALLDGDAISPDTQVLLSDAAGGPIRYHIYAPDGVFVTGYAMPPVPRSPVPTLDQPFVHFDALYKGGDVRVLRLWTESQISGLSGTFTITVWQDQAIRQRFVRDLALRALTVIAALITTVAIVVWFGVNLGLKPLLDLEEAISRRTPKDLTPIQRKVPPETRGIVRGLNRLIGQLRETIDAQNDFISDAAHQLRNPIAGIRALGESILTASSLEVAKSRATELAGAAHHASDLANRLLTLERIRLENFQDNSSIVQLDRLISSVVSDFQSDAAQKNVGLSFESTDVHLKVPGDEVMLREALTNLLDNALVHGGETLSTLTVTLAAKGNNAVVQIFDDGVGLDPSDVPKAMARFGQVKTGEGSGLGLPIAEAVAQRHGGELRVFTHDQGFTVQVALPLQQQPIT